MRIGIDARFIANANAGLGRYTAELVKNLMKIDPESDYVLFVNSKNDIPAEVKQVFAQRARPVEMVETTAKHYTFAEQSEFLSILKKSKLDIMHFTHFNHPLLYRGPFVVTIHDLTLSRFGAGSFSPKQLAYRVIIKDAIKRAKKILVVSNFVGQEIIREYHQLHSKFITTYNAVDPNFRPLNNPAKIAPVLQKYGIDRPYLLYVGQLRPHKNLKRLIDAFRNFSADPKLANQYQLVIGGSGKKHQEQLETHAAKEVASKSIIFTGFLPDEELPALYGGAKLFVFPSLSEGFGIPPLEAAACGTPVVAADATSIPEILGKAALYFDPYSIADIQSKLREALLSQKIRRELSVLGKSQVAKFSWEASARATFKAYQKALEK